MWTLSSSKTNSVISLLQTASEKCNPTEKCHLIVSSSSMLRALSCSQRRKWHRATVLSMTTLSANKRILGNPCHHPGGPMIYSALFEAALIPVIRNTWPLSNTQAHACTWTGQSIVGNESPSEETNEATPLPHTIPRKCFWTSPCFTLLAEPTPHFLQQHSL